MLKTSGHMKLKPIRSAPSLRDQIYDQLKEQVTHPRIYMPGAQLKVDERTLADTLQISRTPIREALARLEQEGLVRIVPRKGIFIVRRPKEEILEMILTWAALEAMAARLSAERASDREIAELRRTFATTSDDEARARIDEYSDKNIGFHRTILALGKCQMLCDLADRLFVHMRAIRARTMHEKDRVQASIVDHLHIIEAIEARDAALAERLVREHTLKLHDHVAETWVDVPEEEADVA